MLVVTEVDMRVSASGRARALTEPLARTGAVGQREVEHEGGEQDGRHLLREKERLELEQAFEVRLHLPRVRPPPPVPRQVVRVRHHLGMHASLVNITAHLKS